MMAVVLRTMALWLLTRGCLGSVVGSGEGCMLWNRSGEDACCRACHPGHHLVKDCGLQPKDICAPCEPGTFTVDLKAYSCKPCRQCVGALVLVKACTATRDTQCRCQDGLTCGDAKCTFCVDKCARGQEPTKDRSCRPCPEGTFNNRSQGKCEPWRTKCPSPGQYIVAKGDAFRDIQCEAIASSPSHKPGKPAEPSARTWQAVVALMVVIALMNAAVIVAVVARRRRKKTKKATLKAAARTQIVKSLTDDPRTLIAIECSFHEAEQEHGSSSESLDSKDSEDQLIV